MRQFFQFKSFMGKHRLVHGVTQKSQQKCEGSLALHTGECMHDIVSNRNAVAEALNLEITMNFVLAQQTHSDSIIVVEKNKMQGWHTYDNTLALGDALITNQKRVILGILTADCVPILLYDMQNNAIGAVHAGWRGTNAAIVAKTVKKMQEVYGTNPELLHVGIAPSIGKCCYEVGNDVMQYFKKISQCFVKNDEKYQLDLPYINRQQLLEMGVLESNIEMSSICTSCEVEHYFSYRKEKGCTGRFMSFIGLT